MYVVHRFMCVCLGSLHPAIPVQLNMIRPHPRELPTLITNGSTTLQQYDRTAWLPCRRSCGKVKRDRRQRQIHLSDYCTDDNSYERIPRDQPHRNIVPEPRKKVRHTDVQPGLSSYHALLLCAPPLVRSASGCAAFLPYIHDRHATCSLQTFDAKPALQFYAHLDDRGYSSAPTRTMGYSCR